MALTPVEAFTWLMATATALLWALEAKLSCSVPSVPRISIAVGALPIPEAAKTVCAVWALAATCTVTVIAPLSGNCAPLTWMLAI